MESELKKDALDSLELFTMPLSKEYKMARKSGKFNCIDSDKHTLWYQYSGPSIRFPFYLLSSCVRDDLMVQELQSLNRYNNSCYRNIEISKNFDNSKIAIGFVQKEGVVSLHSWIEFDIYGDELVVDCTRNVILKKDAYYYLTDAEKIVDFDYKEFDQYILLSQELCDSNDSFTNVEKDQIAKQITRFMNK